MASAVDDFLGALVLGALVGGGWFAMEKWYWPDDHERLDQLRSEVQATGCLLRRARWTEGYDAQHEAEVAHLLAQRSLARFLGDVPVTWEAWAHEEPPADPLDIRPCGGNAP